MKKPKQTGPIATEFTIVVDTREQAPYSFQGLRTNADKGRRLIEVATQRETLPIGDYSLVGLEGKIAIERKSLADLYSTIGQGRDRFERELARLNDLQAAFVVLESEWKEVIASPPPHSELSPKIVYRSCIAWSFRYPRVHWWFLPGRAVAEATTFRLLERFWEIQQGKEKEATAGKDEPL